MDSGLQRLSGGLYLLIEGRMPRLRFVAFYFTCLLLQTFLYFFSARFGAPLYYTLLLTIELTKAHCAIKRFHDIDFSALYFLTLSIPIVNLYFFYRLIFSRGTEGRNQYGLDPLGGNTKLRKGKGKKKARKKKR